MKVKICGLTHPKEAEFLNEAGADYAGFVFFEPSKRNVTLEQSQEIRMRLDTVIKTVAVTVAPDVSLVEKLGSAGFDILQVHKELKPEVLEAVQIPVWYAVNLSDVSGLNEKTRFIKELPKILSDKIEAIVVDAGEYGSGKTFDWKKSQIGLRKQNIFKGRKFILAGGLNASNVEEGIRLFEPDAVDVSSGVESTGGKDRNLIKEFAGKVKGYE